MEGGQKMDAVSNSNTSKLDRRIGPDFLVYWIRISSFIVWLLIGLYLVVSDFARPEKITFFDRILDVSRRSEWDENLMMISFIVALVLFFFSLLSLIINTKRLKRKTDRISFSLVLSLIVSILSILFYLAYAIINLNSLI